MKTILYRIPAKFFPGYKVIKHFHAKVNYDITGGIITVHDVCMSALCLQCINTTGLADRIVKDITEAERKKALVKNLNPTIAAAIAPHI